MIFIWKEKCIFIIIYYEFKSPYHSNWPSSDFRFRISPDILYLSLKFSEIKRILVFMFLLKFTKEYSWRKSFLSIAFRKFQKSILYKNQCRGCSRTFKLNPRRLIFFVVNLKTSFICFGFLKCQKMDRPSFFSVWKNLNIQKLVKSKSSFISNLKAFLIDKFVNVLNCI